MLRGCALVRQCNILWFPSSEQSNLRFEDIKFNFSSHHQPSQPASSIRGRKDSRSDRAFLQGQFKYPKVGIVDHVEPFPPRSFDHFEPSRHPNVGFSTGLFRPLQIRSLGHFGRFFGRFPTFGFRLRRTFCSSPQIRGYLPFGVLPSFSSKQVILVQGQLRAKASDTIF